MAQRIAIEEAGEKAGLHVMRLIYEPAAAAITYGLDTKATWVAEKHVLVFDLGGGSFDVSLLTIEDGIFEMKSSVSEMHLGGEDFTARLMEFCGREFTRKHNMDIVAAKDARALCRLRRCAPRARPPSASCRRR